MKREPLQAARGGSRMFASWERGKAAQLASVLHPSQSPWIEEPPRHERRHGCPKQLPDNK